MKTILFVDNNEILCRFSCDILRREGYRALPRYNALEALDAFEKEDFDILVTELRMEGMSGLELARVLHDRKPHVPVIMVSTRPAEGDVAQVCPKDQLFPTLLERIRTCLESETLTPAN
jgi:CheY-like chemotaxis protein